MTSTFFDGLKTYVGFTAQSSEVLRELHPLARRHFASTVDDFYATIEAHPEARDAVAGGDAQIHRLKQALLRWLDPMLLGPHDEADYEARARIGRVHVGIALPQQYMFTAMNRIRVHLFDVLRAEIGDPDRSARVSTALNQIIDLELAIMLETYREDLIVAVDIHQLRQVLVNLITNASQAMAGRGRLWLEGEPVGGGGAHLRIRDDGPGVPSDDRARIFDALFTTKAKGSGLGLALCRRIMDGHGGTRELENTTTGASFLLKIPAP
jgi:hypothetical protein